MKKIFISLAMALSIVSCSTEELSNGGGNDSQKGVVQLVLSTDGFDVMGSRAVDESAIHDINILEYKAHSLVKQVYLTDEDFSSVVEVSGLEELPATTLDNNSTDAEDNMQTNGIENFIFVVANYGKQIDSQDVSPLDDKLKTFKMEFSGKTDMTNLPMTGFYYGGINKTSTNMMNVTLQRAVAKVNYTLDTSNFAVGGKAPSRIVVNNIKLCNVPNEITLYPCQDRPSFPINGATGKWSGTPFPTASEMASSVTYGDDENQSSTDNTANTYTYVAYIPENVRGSFSTITDNMDKRPSKCESNITDEKADKTYTHILVDLDYTLADGTTKNATYRFYLGGNSTGDMNLLRNTQYNITTFLRGANDADTRITVGDATLVDDMEDEPANCYMIDMSDVQSGCKNVTIPLSQVNNGWAKIAEYDDTQSATASAVKAMLETGNWKIQTEWKTWAGSSSITGTKSSDFATNNLKAVLHIPADVKNGNNAVVKLVSKADGKTYWSWHLWFTDYKPSATGNTAVNGQVHQYISDAFDASKGGIYAGKYMMDRNLGATITGVSGAINQPQTTEDAVKYYGLMYQWGRKDPFVGSGDGTANTYVKRYDANGTEITTLQTTAGSNTESKLAYAVNNPLEFLTTTTQSLWTVKITGLWGENGTKSVFDPCPPGWYVPKNGRTATNNPWAGFYDGNTASTDRSANYSWKGFEWKSSSVVGASGGLYNNSNVQAWFPTSGRLHSDDGRLFDIDNGINYWGTLLSSKVSCCNVGFYPVLGIVNDSSNPAVGFPVRCIQE